MKKLLLLVLCLAFSFATYSQIVKSSEKGTVRVGLQYAYDENRSSERIAFDQYSGYGADYDQPNYSVGLTLDYSITNRFMLLSGINYSDKSLTGTYYCAVCDFAIPPTPEVIELQFIEVPVIARYYLLRARLGIFGEAGIGNLFAISNEMDFKEENHIINGKIGGGIEYSFLDRYAAHLAVDYAQNLTRVFENADYEYNVLGIKLSLIVVL